MPFDAKRITSRANHCPNKGEREGAPKGNTRPLEYHPFHLKDDTSFIPSVVVLRGSRSACVRIFADYLVDVRTQEYEGYRHYLLDFRNGFWESPIDNFRSHYACLHIT